MIQDLIFTVVYGRGCRGMSTVYKWEGPVRFKNHIQGKKKTFHRQLFCHVVYTTNKKILWSLFIVLLF